MERPDGHRISSVRPDEVLSVGDRLTFAGNVTRILDLQEMRGLVSVQERHFGAIRGRYGGAVIAIHRADERVEGKLGEVRLRPGDVLLVLAGPAFRPRALDRRAFLLVAPLDGDGPPLLGVLLATILITEMISNNAAAALLFPVALATATSAGLDPRPFAFAVAIGASSSFLTPIGYQTNTMVYGVGGDRFTDFARLGFPLVIVMVAVSLLTIPIAWPLR